MTNVPAGWHQDPSNPNQERWWDGSEWSGDQVRPKTQTDAPNQPPTNQFPTSGPPTQATTVGSTAPESGQSNASYQNQPYANTSPQGSGNGGGNGMLFAIIGGAVVLLLLIGTVAIVALSGGDDETEARTGTAQQAGSDTAGDTPGDAPTPSDGSPAPQDDLPATDGTEDVGACALQDEAIVIDITNSTDTINTYDIDIALLDDAGNRVDDDWYYVQALRPGENAKELQPIFEDEPTYTSCEVLDVSRNPIDFEPDLMSHASACGLEADRFSVTSSMTVTNPDATDYDYDITLAITGPEGFRIATGTTYVQNVRPNEPTAADSSLYAIDEDSFTNDHTCEVVQVSRNESS